MTIYAVITQDHDMTNRVDVELFNDKEGAANYARSTVKGANYYEFDWEPGDDGEVFFFAKRGLLLQPLKNLRQ